MYSLEQQLTLIKALEDALEAQKAKLRAGLQADMTDDWEATGADRRAVYFGDFKAATVTLEGMSEAWEPDDMDAFLDYANELGQLDTLHVPREGDWETLFKLVQPMGYAAMFEFEEKPSKELLDGIAVVNGQVVNQATGEVVPGLRARKAVPKKMVVRSANRDLAKHPERIIAAAAQLGGLETFLLGGGDND